MLKPNRKRLNSLKKLLDVIQSELSGELKKSQDEKACFFIENSVRELVLVIDSI